MEQNNILNYTMKCLMDKSIKTAIVESGFSDIELGYKLNVSRSTIHNWRTKENYKIRSSNIVALGKLLKKNPTFVDGSVFFEENETMENDMPLDNDDVIQDLRRDKIMLNELINSNNREILALRNHIKDIDAQFKKLNESFRSNNNIPQIDHHSLQIITRVDNNTYHSVSSAYAKLLEQSPIEMMQEDFSWSDCVHEDDHFKFGIIHAFFKELGRSPSSRDYKDQPFNNWKLKTKSNKIVYVSANTIPVGNLFSYVEMEISSKSAYIKEINRYKNNLVSI